MSKNIIFPILFIVICILKSCDSNSKSEDLDFYNTIWELQYINDEDEIIKPTEEQIYTIQFETDSTFSGRNDCNDLIGKYKLLPENKIDVLNAGGSYANCGDNSLFLDYMSALQSAKSYNIFGNILSIFFGTNSELLFYGQWFQKNIAKNIS